jgi:hypothetical protein
MDLPSDNAVVSNSYLIFGRSVLVENDLVPAFGGRGEFETCLSPDFNKKLLITAFIAFIVQISAHQFAELCRF